VLGFESWFHLWVTLFAGLAAGAANTVAGGGTVISFPVLVWIGLPPVQANATNTVGLWTGSIGGAWSYRGRLGTLQAKWRSLAFISLVGGGVGAWLLVNLPPSWFASIAPFMVLGAAVLIAVEPLVRKRLVAAWSPEGRGGTVGSMLGVLVVSLYGGYFGAGIGLLLLVALALLGIENLHHANALKNLLVVGIKGVAVAYFAVVGVLDWPVAIVMVVGSTIGGWAAGFLVQKVQPATLRWIIVGLGMGMGLVMVIGTYL